MTRNTYKFAAACQHEPTVFGASKPGYSHQQVCDWVEFMKSQNIKRVCCLLSETQLAHYSNLLGRYQQEFGGQNVCWAPIEDFHLSSVETMTQKILPFFMAADKKSEKVVVHCSGGIGRTGHVLAAWLVSGRGFSNQAAIAAVKSTGRNPYEAAIRAMLTLKNPLQVVKELNLLLDSCRAVFCLTK
jgi:protein-tyrosine phosphatase